MPTHSHLICSQPIGTQLGVTVQAEDDDAGDFIHYSLIAHTSGGLFDFDDVTLNITIATRIDYDAADAIHDAVIGELT